MDHFSNLLHKIRVVTTNEELDHLTSELLSATRPLVISFLNAHAMTLAEKNTAFYEHLMASDLLLRDGIGTAIAMKCLGMNPGMNMNGTDYIPHLLTAAAQRRLAVYGTKSPWLDAAIKKLALQHEIVSVSDGFQPDDYYTRNCPPAKPEIVLLAMGMPKQERVAIQLRSAMGKDSVLVINGGAILDFIAERVARAPDWVRRCKMEWLFRLMNEPRRLLHRYTIGILLFFYYLLRSKFSR